MTRVPMRFVAAALFVAVQAPAGLFAQNASTPGAIGTPYPTTQAISLEWAVAGDANLNGVVAVRYREQGAAAWKTGMPLRRVPAGSTRTAAR